MPEKPFLRVMTGEEFNELLRNAPPPTVDDVTITSDGRRLDSKEAVGAFCAGLAAEKGRLTIPSSGESLSDDDVREQRHRDRR